MKETIIIIVTLILVFVPNFFFKNFLDSSGGELVNLVEEMKAELEVDEGGNEEKSKELEEAFLEKEKKWILIVDHDILDEIENAIAECVAFYNANDYMEFESSSNKLKNSIEDLTKREELSFSNIL